IFEVRGYPRVTRGRLLPITVRDGHIEFGYEGLDGVLRTTTIAADDTRLVEPVDDPDTWPGANVLVCWRARLATNERATFGWTVKLKRRSPSHGKARKDDGTRPAPVPTAPTRSPVPPGEQERQLEMPRIGSDHEMLDRTLRRSLADLTLLRNHGPADGESYLA